MTESEVQPSTAGDSNAVDVPATPGVTPGDGAIPSGQEGQATAAGGAMPPAGEGEQQRLAAALRSEREARKKAEQAVKDLQKSQTDGLSESEKLVRRVAELEIATKKAERDALILRVAQEYSIPPLLASRLHGQTEDELREDAESLKAVIPASQPTNTTQSVGGPQGPPSAQKSPEEWTTYLRSKR